MKAHSVTFDTLQFSKRLTEAGLQPKISEELTEVMAEVLQDNEFTTKPYFDFRMNGLEEKINTLSDRVVHLEEKINTLSDRVIHSEKYFDTKIDDSEKRLDINIGGLRRDFDEKLQSLEKRLDINIGGLRRDFDEKLQSLEKSFDIKLEGFEKHFDEKLQGLEKRFDEKLDVLGKSLRIEMDAKLVSLETRLVKWMVSLFITNITIVSALIAVSQYIFHLHR